MSSTPFKTCTTCNKEWLTREDLLADPEAKLAGYQVNFKELETGLFLFDHSCGTTLAMHAGDFRDLYDGNVFTACATDRKECQGLCLHKSNLEPCPAQCECSYVRDIIQTIKDYPKA